MLGNTPTVVITMFKNSNKSIYFMICFCGERHTKVSSLYTLIKATERTHLVENTIKFFFFFRILILFYF